MMEKIAEMMIRCSLATGHGDTVEDLLAELELQIKELQGRTGKKFCAMLTTGVCDLPERIEAAEAELAQARKALEEIAAHPREYMDERTSYGVGWAFYNVQNIAIRALKGEPK